MMNAILFLSDKSSNWIIDNFNQLAAIENRNIDVFFLYHKRNNQIPDSIQKLNHYTFTDDALHQLKYKPIENTLVPGSNHFPLMQFYLDHSNYDYYWIIEDDVIFNGDWSFFFRSFESQQADFISSYIRLFHEIPNWYWWFTLHTPNELQTEKVSSFNPVYRLSNASLKIIDHALKNGWSGHHEVLIPSLLNEKCLKIVDMGETGFFTKKGTTSVFYTPETLSYLPVEVQEKQNLLYHPVKEKKEIDLNALKTSCVISAVGKDSLHREWIKEDADFDLHLIIYDNSYNKFYSDSNFISYQKGYKFKLVYDYLQKHPEYLNKYDYFFVPDDDISIDPTNISTLFRIMQEQKLEIAQPALSDSYYTYEHTMKQKGVLLRYTNFVEMMVPCFSRDALKKILFTFNEDISGWGIEFHWSELIGFTGAEMAIIDDLHCVHTRNIQSCNERNETELHQYLQKYNLNAEIKEYGQINLQTDKKSNAWITLFERSDIRSNIKEKIDVISRILLASVHNVESIGLSEGRIGISLFFFNYYQLTGKRKYYDIALSVFESINHSLADVSSDVSLSTGLVGVSWMVEHLAQCNLTDNETDDVLEEICVVMDAKNPLDILARRTESIEVDNILEYGMHYLARIRNPKHNPAQNASHLTEKYILFQIIDFLEANKTDYSVEKYSIPKGNDKEWILKKYNTHCAIIYFLGLLQNQNLGHTKLKLLLIEYNDSLYQVVSKTELTTIQQLQFATTLLSLGLVTKSKAGEQLAMDIAYNALDVKSLTPFSLSDSLYIAHLYSRLFQASREEKFRVAAITLIEHFLEKVDLTQYVKDRRYGFCDGLVGIGLKLTASIAYFEPMWNELLYLVQPTSSKKN